MKNLNKKLTGIVILGVFLALVSGCFSRSYSGFRVEQEGDWSIGDVSINECEQSLNGEDIIAECGTVYVPKNWDAQTDGALLPLKFIRYGALGKYTESQDPIFFFHGGPGASNFQLNYIDPVLSKERHVVVIGYRGIDAGVDLSCPEVIESFKKHSGELLSNLALDNSQNSFSKCFERLAEQGVDINDFDMIDVIRDVDSLRKALGYTKINLLSQSYGTRLAQYYSLTYPQSVNKNVMTAVNPPGHFEWSAAGTEQVLMELNRFCQKDSYCASRTSSLAELIKQTRAELPPHWNFIPISEESVLIGSFLMLYDINNAGMIFDIWFDAKAGDYSGLALLSFSIEKIFPYAMNWGDLASKAGVADYNGKRPVNVRDLLIPSEYSLGAAASVIGWAGAGAWEPQRLAQRYIETTESDVQSLLLSGSVDFSTPAHFSTEKLLPFLKNSHQIIVEGAGHKNIWQQREAMSQLVNEYLLTGVVRRDLILPQNVSFEPKVDLSFWAKIIYTGGLLLITIAVLLLWWLSIKFYRKIKRTKSNR